MNVRKDWDDGRRGRATPVLRLQLVKLETSGGDGGVALAAFLLLFLKENAWRTASETLLIPSLHSADVE